MQNDPSSLINRAKIEKILLAKQVGQFLIADQADEERAAVEDVARQLAMDISVQVRAVLAFELRKCTRLVPDLAERIAKDVEAVSGPFLEVTKAISDKTFLRLIPQLEEFARAALARRSDLSPIVVQALAKMGAERSVTSLVRNDMLQLEQRTCNTVVERFGGNVRVMDQFSARRDLSPALVERIIDRVSDHCRVILVEQYALGTQLASELIETSKVEILWSELQDIDPMQVHALVTDMRAARRLNHMLTLEIARKGCMAFMESALALEAGLPLERVRNILALEDQQAFVRLMRMANVSKTMAPKFLKLAKENYTQTSVAA